MDIYVSNLKKVKGIKKWRFNQMSFLFSDDRRALHDLAHAIGLHPYMFVNAAHFPHYQLSPNKFYQALNRGAKCLNDIELQEWIQKSTACCEG